MAEKIKTVILYRQILSSKRTVHRQRLKGEIHRHVETTHEIRGKAQKEKWLFAAIAQVVIQTGMDSSAHNSSSVSVTSQDHAIPRFFFGELCCELGSSGGHFCERNACASVASAAKLIAPHRNPSEIRHSATIRGAENTSSRWSRHPLNFFCYRCVYTSIIWSAVPKKRQ